MGRLNYFFPVIIIITIFLHVSLVLDTCFCDTTNINVKNNKAKVETMTETNNIVNYKHEIVVKYNNTHVSVSLDHGNLNVEEALNLIEKELDNFPYSHVIILHQTKEAILNNFSSKLLEILRKHNDIQLLVQSPSSYPHHEETLINPQNVLGIVETVSNDEANYTLLLLPVKNNRILEDTISPEESLKIIEKEIVNNKCSKLTLIYDYEQQNIIDQYLLNIESLAKMSKIPCKIIRIKEMDYSEDKKIIQKPSFQNPNNP